MSANNFHTTIQDLRKEESKLAQAHVGKPRKESDISAMKPVISESTNKQAEIDRAKATLHLPIQLPTPSDWSFRRPYNRQWNLRLQQPVSGSWEMNENQNTEPFGNFGRQGKDNLGRLPKDALTR
ncbi:uncharacterized protein ATNIH1004_000652 [Aspergillus tanneri]|uniref:Uncharacterized protein n=1 Tax=Aspergillus tanneri TaxID=1220188 RepID=A0A5M9N0I1_9EURO|nr:uncharacterized protein ATNIH1004_000652 [Aspergillus tanneri]KAA8651756.1 hypothetical protein ATNIH1004_000652 [Aspergillus tanneri]